MSTGDSPQMTTRAGSVVAIGGGHGLATVLKALVDRCESLTAVVSVADNGGSSGRLRRDLGIIAPGDMRRCLAALTPRGLVRDALTHRFAYGELAGHAAGNVLVASMLDQGADPVTAMDALAKVVGCRGRVLPATLHGVDLVATTKSGTVMGQVAIGGNPAIESLRFVPGDPEVPQAVLAALASAEMVVIGPGSLYTSVLAAAVPGVRDAIAASAALVVYVANLATERAETTGYDLASHVAAVHNHGIEPDIVLSGAPSETPDDLANLVVACPLSRDHRARHDPDLLGGALVACLDHRIGLLNRRRRYGWGLPDDSSGNGTDRVIGMHRPMWSNQHPGNKQIEGEFPT